MDRRLLEYLDSPALALSASVAPPVKLEAPPIAILPEGEGRPVVGRLPCLLAPHLDLRGSKGGSGALPTLEHLLVKLRHQLRGRFVAYAPQAHHDPRRAGIHEPSRQPDQPFTSDLFAETGLTRAEDDELGWEREVEDLVGAEKTVLRIALLVHHRQDER